MNFMHNVTDYVCSQIIIPDYIMKVKPTSTRRFAPVHLYGQVLSSIGCEAVPTVTAVLRTPLQIISETPSRTGEGPVNVTEGKRLYINISNEQSDKVCLTTISTLTTH